MSDTQLPKGRLLFVTESANECFCADVLAALRGEGFEIVGINDSSQLVPLVYRNRIALIIVFGDGKRMFRSQMDELEIADNVIPVLYLYTQKLEGTWPEFVTFYPWPGEIVQATLDAVLQLARQKCHIMEVPAAVLH